MTEQQPACADPTTSAELWFPDRSNETYAYAYARAICAKCPVKPQCATIGIGEEHGMWAGLTPDERHTIRKRTGTPVNPPARQWLPQIGA